MGGSSSKVAKTAGAAAARQYPSRTPTSTTSAPASSRINQRQETHSNRQEEPGPVVHTNAQASGTRTEAIDLDARDPHFAQRLQEVGPVQAPSPTWSPSSTASPTPVKSATTEGAKYPDAAAPQYPSKKQNPALAILAARDRIQQEADAEKTQVGRAGFEGKQYLDISTVRKILVLRDEQGMGAEDIERYLRLQKGVVAMMGPRGVVEAA